MGWEPLTYGLVKALISEPTNQPTNQQWSWEATPIPESRRLRSRSRKSPNPQKVT